MNTNVFARVCKISLAACLALVLGTSFADASHYGRSYSHQHRQPSHHGHGGYGQRSYNPPQYGGYHRPPQHCAPRYQPQPHYGFSGGYQGGSYGRYR